MIGNDNTDKATVSFADHTYVVRGEPGGNEVLVGDHGSGCAHDAKANASPVTTDRLDPRLAERWR